MIDGEIMQVDPESLITEVLKLKHRDYRLIQICAANAGDGFDVFLWKRIQDGGPAAFHYAG